MQPKEVTSKQACNFKGGRGGRLDGGDGAALMGTIYAPASTSSTSLPPPLSGAPHPLPSARPPHAPPTWRSSTTHRASPSSIFCLLFRRRRRRLCCAVCFRHLCVPFPFLPCRGLGTSAEGGPTSVFAGNSSLA